MNPIIALARALYPRKLEIFMTHRAKDILKTLFFLLLGPSAPQFLTYSKKLVKSIIIPGYTTQNRKLEVSMTHRENLNLGGGESLLDPQTK